MSLTKLQSKSLDHIHKTLNSVDFNIYHELKEICKKAGVDDSTVTKICVDVVTITSSRKKPVEDAVSWIEALKNDI